MTGSALRTAFLVGSTLFASSAAGMDLAPPPGPLSACWSPLRQDRLEAITPDGDLLLANGGPARLSGIRLPDSGPHREAALRRLGGWAGRSVRIAASDTRDRWNRLSAVMTLDDGPEERNAAGILVGEGLALFDPGKEERVCVPELPTLEERARQRGLGVWGDGVYKPLSAEQTEGLQERVGRFVLVEGRVRSVGERKERTYLNFGGHWAEDFTIVIPRRTWRLMRDRGIDARTLRGQDIRARGILQSWQGTALTIAIPEAIERLPSRRFAR